MLKRIVFANAKEYYSTASDTFLHSYSTLKSLAASHCTEGWRRQKKYEKILNFNNNNYKMTRSGRIENKPLDMIVQTPFPKQIKETPKSRVWMLQPNTTPLQQHTR